MSGTAVQPPKVGNVAQACDICRLKKRKCDLPTKAGNQKCSACERSKSVCQMTHVTKPRERRKKKQMENLEDRLRSLEELIRSSVAAKVSEPRPNERPDALTPSSLPSMSTPTDPVSMASDSGLPEASGSNNETSPNHTMLEDLGQGLLRTTSPHFTSSLGRQIPHLGSMPPFWEANGSAQYEIPASNLSATDVDLRPRVRVNGDKKCSLPPIQGGLFLLQEYLVDYNTAVPVFDANTISTLFHDCYNGRIDARPIDWVALKVVLAIAHRLRAMSPLGVPQDTENAEIYLEESLLEVPRLLMMRPSLLLAQCLLGLAIIISTSSRPFPAAMLVTLAMRVIQDLRVNDPTKVDAVNSGDFLQQQRVFWIAYFIDADMSLRAGRLPSLTPRLINVELPSDTQPDAAGDISATSGEFKVNIFRLHVELALLQAEFMEQLVTPRSSRNPECPEDAELCAIESRLEEWRRNWLFELSVESLRTALHRSDLVHVVVLESEYFSTIYAFRAHISPVSRPRIHPFSVEGLMEGMSKQKVQMLYKDARRFVDLLKLIPGDNIACNWLALEATVSALVVILAHIIFNPRDESCESDFNVSTHMLHILHQLSNISKDSELASIHTLCVDIYLRAERALQEQRSFGR